MTEQCDQKLISRDFLNIYYKKLLQQTSNGAYILTSHDFSWLQNGQLNCVSNGSIAFRFVGGFLLLFLLPIYLHRKRKLKIKKKEFSLEKHTTFIFQSTRRTKKSLKYCFGGQTLRRRWANQQYNIATSIYFYKFL